MHSCTLCPLVKIGIIGAATDLVKDIQRDLFDGQKLDCLLSVISADQAHSAVL